MGFTHQRDHGETGITREEFACVFLRAPHRDRLNRPHADHDQSTEAKYQRRRQRGFDPFALYRGRIRYQIRHWINQLSVFRYGQTVSLPAQTSNCARSILIYEISSPSPF